MPFWYSPKPNFIVNVHFHRMYGYKFWLENKNIIIFRLTSNLNETLMDNRLLFGAQFVQPVEFGAPESFVCSFH